MNKVPSHMYSTNTKCDECPYPYPLYYVSNPIHSKMCLTPRLKLILESM